MAPCLNFAEDCRHDGGDGQHVRVQRLLQEVVLQFLLLHLVEGLDGQLNENSVS